MAIGIDADGKEVKNVQASLTPLLSAKELSVLDKQRLLMMCAHLSFPFIFALYLLFFLLWV